MTYDYCEKVSMSDIREKIPDLVVMEKWAPYVGEVNVLGGYDYLLFDGNEIYVDGRKYQLKAYHDKTDMIGILNLYRKPDHIPSTQMPCMYDVFDDEGWITTIHDWMLDGTIAFWIDEGRLARAEIWKEEAALDDGGLTWKCG